MFEARRESRTQRARLDEDGEGPDGLTAETGDAAVAETLRTGEVSEAVAGAAGGGRFGTPGKPLNHRSPFYMGFVGAFGVVIAIGLWHLLGSLQTTLTILLVAGFIALALDPIVTWLMGKGRGRGLSVCLVLLGFALVLVLITLLVVPPVVSQSIGLVQAAPDYIQRIMNSDWVQHLNNEYDVLDKIETELKSKATDARLYGNLFGGIVGAGALVVNIVFQVFTILVVTIYLLTSLPAVKEAAYALVPRSRRPRFTSLSEEILRRVGAYALGQVGVASVNAALSFVMMTIVGIPYAAILAVVVGLLGLIPMVGATIGAVIVCIVAAFTGIKLAIIAGIYYVVYQQFENYVVAPRVMARTVSVPGLVTVLAAMIGGTLMGILGALIAIPVAAGLILIYQEVVVPRQNAH